MNLYTTNYKSGKTLYGSHIWAASEEQFRELLAKRKLPQESLICTISEPVPQYYIEEMGKIPKTLDLGLAHYLMFLGYVALCSGKKPVSIFSDVGVCHEAIHNASAVQNRANFGAYHTQEFKEKLFEKSMRAVEKLAKELGLLP